MATKTPNYENNVVEADPEGFVTIKALCSSRPYVVIKNVGTAVKMDFQIFDTDALVKSNPNYEVTCDEFSDLRGSCLNFVKRTPSTVKKHAEYQTNFRPERTSKLLKFGIIHFDTSAIDGHWAPQIQELQKLPQFLQVSSAGDLLSHIGYPIYGVNTPQMYMKVQGNSTALHQEDANLCSVNLNFGPGNVTWWFVDRAYWNAMQEEAKRNEIDFFGRLWWPNVDKLRKAGIPVSVAVQEPGDIIYTNVGTIHWVRSDGRTNAIAWNIGPKTAVQYCIAIERYELFKTLRKPNVIPMEHVIWNFAKDGGFCEKDLFDAVKSDLGTSLKRTSEIKNALTSANVSLEPYVRSPKEPYLTCEKCKGEIFGFVFVKKIGRQLCFCFACVDDLQEFDCVQECRLEDLKRTFDNYVKPLDIFNLAEILRTLDGPFILP